MCLYYKKFLKNFKMCKYYFYIVMYYVLKIENLEKEVVVFFI